ncbi:MAG: gamma-glutamyltransferase family protein [Deltaproteobacteria bacterium]|nr:gamma-glutamyltransferase family protein [Deltaproteobacteria bacterium]
MLRTRSAALGLAGAVATSHPLASLEAIEVLRSGGNAIDAAVTAALVLGVVEPMSVGIGGDAFALLWSAAERRLVGYAGNGASPAGLTPGLLAGHGLDRIPERGPLSITVPGAIDAYAALLTRLGTRTLADCLAPAIRIARAGFAASEVVARSWATARPFASWQGPAPREGETVRLPLLASTMERVARGGREEMYRGALAHEIARAVREAGGVLTPEDLAEHRGAWVDPLDARYRGVRVAELPPPGQGVAALVALRILERFDLFGRGWDDPLAWHLRIEAVKRAMAERDAHVSDPASMTLGARDLLDDAPVAAHARSIDPWRADPAPRSRIAQSGTVYLATADAEGNLVSLIASLYYGFGSGVVAGSTGVVLQNRAFGFAPVGDHPNAPGPRKRPLHTIIPAMLLDSDGVPRAAFGVMGGAMQAQGHVQVVSHVVDHGLDWQRALEAPRFRWTEGARVLVEDGTPDVVRDALSVRGHEVARAEHVFGGGQVVARMEGAALSASSDPRKDGCALAY